MGAKMNDVLTTVLSGSAKDRRRKLREIRRKYPDAVVTVYAPITYGTVYDYVVTIGFKGEAENANVPRTQVRITGGVRICP
jgi:hypothetical protein